jgi:hypothetical protein
LSAFLFYSVNIRPSVRHENPYAAFDEIGKIIGASWQSLSDEAKAPYKEQANADKARYDMQKIVYDARRH